MVNFNSCFVALAACILLWFCRVGGKGACVMCHLHNLHDVCIVSACLLQHVFSYDPEFLESEIKKLGTIQNG